MDINLAAPWKQQMSRGKHYLSKNLLRCVENLFCIDRKHHTLSVFKLIFHLQFQNMDIVFLLLTEINKKAAVNMCTILICFSFQYLTMFVDDFNFEVFEQFMQHLSLCADSYRAASNREQRRIVLTNLFISCDHSGVSQASKVFSLPSILQFYLYLLV